MGNHFLDTQYLVQLRLYKHTKRQCSKQFDVLLNVFIKHLQLELTFVYLIVLNLQY